MATFKISLKLLIDTKGQKVLFAEAGKEFVDFLFSILSIPVGTVIRLLKSQSTVGLGCLGKLYQSIEDLNENYMLSSQNKEAVLEPMGPAISINTPLLTNDTEKSHIGISGREIYLCNRCNDHVTDVPNARCPRCHSIISFKPTYVSQNISEKETTTNIEGGFVKGVVTYMIMDDLEVKPMLTISSVTLLNKFKIQEIDCRLNNN